MVAAGERDFPSLLQTYETLSESDREFDAFALITLLGEALADASSELGDKEGSEYLIRAASLCLLHDTPEGHDQAAIHLARAWERYPSTRILEMVVPLFDAKDLGDMPDGVLVATSELGESKQRIEALQLLTHRSLAGNNTGDAHRYLDSWLQLSPEDPQALNLRAELGDPATTDETEPVEDAEEAQEAVEQSPENIVDTEDVEGSEEDEPTGSGSPRPEGSADEVIQWIRENLPEASAARRVMLRRGLFTLLRESSADATTLYESLSSDDTPPSDVSVILEEADTFISDGEWESAAAHLEASVDEVDDAHCQGVLLREMARVLEAGVGDRERAENAYRRLRMVAPDSLTAMAFYADWIDAEADPRRAYAVLSQCYGMLTSRDTCWERLALARNMVEIATQRLESPDKAIEAWRRVLADDPGDEEANGALRVLYTDTERWHALAEHLDAWATGLSDEEQREEKVALLFELASLYQDPNRLPMDELVASTYQRISLLSPANERALEHLASRFEEGEQWHELVSVLARKVEVTEEPGELIELFMKIAELYLERMRSDAEAIPVLELVLELDPENPEILRKLRKIHQRRYDSERLYETYQRELPLLDGSERLAVLTELARLAERELQREEEAHRWWGEVLDTDPRHEEALTALQAQHTSQGNWDSYATLLERRIEGARTRKQRVELLLELGEVAHARLNDESRALDLYRQVCEISPFNSTARGRLRGIFIDSQDWTRLRELYAPREDWSGYLCLLRDHLQRVDTAKTCDLLVEIANAESDLLENEDGARMALVSAMAENPERVDVADRILSRHEDGIDDEARRDALLSIARHHDDPTRSEAAWRDLATQWGELGVEDATLEALGHVLCYEADRGLVDGLEALMAWVERSDAWDICSSIISDALERLPFEAKDSRVSLHRQLGHILRSRVGDPDAAREHLMAVLEDAPGDEHALGALEEIYLSRTDFEGLESVLRMRADQAIDQTIVVQSLRRLGQLYEDALIDLPRASRTYQEILELTPEDEAALDALRRTRLVSDGQEALAGDLEDLIPRLADPVRQHQLQLELARLYRDPLNQVTVAVDLLRELLNEEGSTQDEALAVLEAMFASGEATDSVAPILDETYRQRSDLPRLAHVLQVRLRIADTLDEQLGLIEELQSHYEGELANPSSAFDVVSTRFTLDPNDERTWEDLQRLASVTGRWESLADLWRGALSEEDSETPGPAGRNAINDLRVTLAGVLREKLEADDEAIQLYEEAIANADDPADYSEVLDLLETLYGDREQLEDLVRIRLLASEAALDGDRRRQKLLGACDILAGPLERPEDVLEHYELLAAEDPSDVEYADRLEGTYERLGRWAELTEHLEKRAEALRTPEATDRLHFRGAMVRYKHLGELDGAVEDLLKLIASEHIGDQVRQVLVDLCADPDSMSDALRAVVISALQDHYGEVRDPLGQAMLLEVQAGYSSPGMSRAHLLLEAAGHVLEAWNDDLAPSTRGDDLRVRAFDYYAEALREVPTSAVTLSALDDLVQQLERWEPYADLMVEVAEACPEPATAVGLRHRAAVTIQQHLDNVERAVLAWESVLNSDRRHAGNYRPEALHALDSLYEKTDRRAARVNVLQQLAETADRTMTRVRLLQETARLLHDLGRNEEAISTLQSLLREARGTRRRDLLEVRQEALTHLDILLTETRRHEELIQLLMESPNDDDDVDQLQLYRAAEIAEEKLQRPPEAIAIYEQILEADPHDEIALDALDRLFGTMDRWEDKAALFDARLEMAEAAEDVEQVCELLFARGQLEQHQLLDLDRAVTSYGEALGRDPAFAPAIAALDDCVAEPGVAIEARRALADAHRRGHRPEALANVLEVTLSEASEPTAETGSLHTELAYLYLDALETPWDAWTHAQAAYRDAPSAREGIERRNLAVRAGIAADQRPLLPSFLLQVASSLESDAATVERLVADVALLRDQGYPEEDLVPFWEHVLSVDSRHAVALDTLESRAREEGSGTRIAQILKLRIQGDPQNPSCRSWRMELADLLADQGDGGGSIDVLEGLRSENSGDTEAIQRLMGLYRQQGRWEPLLTILDEQARTEDGSASTEMQLQIAEIAVDELEDHSRAVSALEAVLARNATNNEALEIAERLWKLNASGPQSADAELNETTLALLTRAYETSECWDTLEALYIEALERPMDDALREQTLRSLADVKANRLDDLEGAYQTHRQLVEIAREPAAHLAALERLAEEISAWGPLVDFYEQLVAEGRGGADLRRRTSELAYEVLDDLPRALTHQRALLSANPRDEKARDAVTRLLEESQQWEALVSHLRETAESTREPGDKFEYLVRAAEVLEGELGRDTDAASLLQTAVELAPSAAETAEHLAELLIRTGDRGRLHAHYRSWIERSEGHEALALRMRLATSLVEEPGTALSGVEELQDLITSGDRVEPAREALDEFLMEPSRSGTRWRGAVEAAVDVIESTESTPLPPRRRAAIAEALARVAPLGPDLRSARMDAAEAWEHAGEPAAALRYLDALLQQKADDAEIIQLLDALAGRHDLWSEVNALYEASHARDLPPALAADRAYHIAEIHRDRLQDEESTARWFETMLATPADRDPERWDEAFRFLASYYEGAEDPEGQARILQMWLDATDVSSEERERLRSGLAAVLMDQLERPDEALALLEQDLQHVLSDDALLKRAETLYRQTERFGPLVQLLDLGISQLEPSEPRFTDLLERKLSVAEDGLGDAAIIREATNALLELNPHHGEALNARERLAIRQEDWSTLEDTLAVRLDVTDEPEVRMPLLMRRATLAEEHLNRPELAIACAEEIQRGLSGDAEERPQLVAILERLLSRGDEIGSSAAALLELHYRLDERWNDYAHVLRVRLETTPATEDRVEAALLLAETLEARLEEPERALETLVDEIRSEGDVASLRQEAQRLAEETVTFSGLADALETRLNETDAETDVIRLVSPWLAEIARDRLQQPPRACRALERGIEVSPTDLSLLEAAAPLYNQTGEWHALQRIYMLQAKAQDEPDRVQTWRQLALLNETELHDLGGAREAWEQILEVEPEDGEALESLLRIAERNEAWEDVDASIERLLAQPDAQENRRSLLIRRSRNALEHLRDPGAALRWVNEAEDGGSESDSQLAAIAIYESLLEHGEARAAAAERLAHYHEENQRWEHVVTHLAIVTEEATDDAVWEDLSQRIAEIQEESLGRPEAAFHTYLGALRRAPHRLGHRPQMERLAAELDGWSELTSALEDGSADIAGGDKVALCLWLGRLYSDQLNDVEGAILSFEKVLEEEPSHSAALLALEGRYQERSAWRDLVRILKLRLENTASPTEQVSLLRRVVAIAEERLDDIDLTRTACDDILQIEPDDGDALATLERLARKRDDWESLDLVLERRIAQAEEETIRIRLKLKRADNALHNLHRQRAALDLLLEVDQGSLSPEDADHLVDLYEALLGSDDLRVEISRRLAGHYERMERWEDLVGVLLNLLEELTDGDEVCGMALRCAEIADTRLEDPEGGLDILLTAFSRFPARTSLRQRIAGLAEAADAWHPVADTLSVALSHAQGGDDTASLGTWLASIRQDRLADARGAADALEKVLTVDPVNTEVMVSLDDLYQELGQVDDRRRLLESRLAAAPDIERPLLLEDLAILAEKERGPMEALKLWRELIWERPDHQGARDALRRLLDCWETTQAVAEVLEPIYRREGMWEDLAVVLEHRLQAARDDEGAARIHENLADLYDARLDDEERAFDHAARAMEVHGVRTEPLRRLERMARNLGRWNELADVLERALPPAEPPDPRVACLVRIARVHEEHTGKADRALKAWQEVLELAPDNEAALAGLRQHQTSSEADPASRVEVVTRLARVTTQQGRQVDLWREVAELAQQEGMLEEERGACEELLNLASDDWVNVDRLAEIYEETERYEELVGLLSHRAEELTDDKESAALYWRMGQIRETRLTDLEGAMGDYSEAWSRDVEQRLAYTSLETYYRHHEDWPELLSLMSSRADRTPDATEALATWLDMGEVAGERLNDVTESLRCYERALESDPNCEKAIDEIIRLYQKLDRVKALSDLYERKAGLVEDPTERCSYMGLAAELYANRLAQPERAEEVVNSVLDEMPEHPTARRVLAEIRIGQEAYDEAAELLEAAMGQMGDTHRVDALLHLGHIYGEHLDRPADALRAYEAARDLVPDHPDINQSLHHLYEQTGAWDGLRETLETEYERSHDPIARCGRALAVAKLHLEQLEDDEGFFAWIQLAREARRDSPEVAEALVSYHTSREEWSEAAPNLEWLVNYLDGKRLTHEIPRKAHHLAQILTQMGEKEKALEYHKMAMQADGSYLPNLLDYGDLLVNQGAWDRAVRIYQNILLQRSTLEDETVATVLERLSGCADELGWGEEADQYRKRLHTDFPDRS